VRDRERRKNNVAANKKKESAAVKLGPAIKAALLCALIGGLGVAYVGLKRQIHDLARQIEQREKALKQHRDLNAKLHRQFATLSSPPFLQARVQELRLDLAPPAPAQVVRLVEAVPATEWAVPSAPPAMIAGQNAPPRPPPAPRGQRVALRR
jgi:cell division protein FtsB